MNETWGQALSAILSPITNLVDWRLIWASVVQIIIAGIIGVILHTVIGLGGLAYILGGIIWTIILCFTPTVKLWFIKPLGNHAIVLEHAWRKKERVDLNQATRLQPTRTCRVVYGPKFTGKSMFETPLNGVAIDLRRSLGLEEAAIPVSTKDGANHTIKFWTACTPIQTDECLINLARHTESAVVEYFRRSFIGYLQRATVSVKTTDDLLRAMSVDGQGQPGVIAKGFNELFGGKDKIDDEEKIRGMFTGDPKCELTIDPKFQKIRQAKPAAQLKRDAINVLTDGPRGINPDIAANMVASDVGDDMPAEVKKFVVEAPHGAGNRDLIIALDGRGR